MKLNNLFSLIVICIFLMVTLVVILNRRERKGRTELEKGGFILDFTADQDESDDDKRYFRVDGFQYYGQFPMWKIRTLRSSEVWLLRNTNGERLGGSIQLTNFQKDWERPQDVVVDITYHVSWEDRSGLTVSGINLETGEQVQEMLNSVTEPSIYCRKLIFLGPVEQVTIEGYATEKTSFVVIDELKVAVGTDSYDKEEEFMCS
jgi:hypothetical protein